MPQVPSNIQGTLQPQNQSLQHPVQPQHVQQHQVVRQHFPPMQQMAQHHFPQEPHFIAQIHPQFVTPLPQLIYPQTGNGIAPHIPQQPVDVEQQQQQHTIYNYFSYSHQEHKKHGQSLSNDCRQNTSKIPFLS
jgi:hypothetical protein